MYKLYHVGSRRSTKDNRNIITAMWLHMSYTKS